MRPQSSTVLSIKGHTADRSFHLVGTSSCSDTTTGTITEASNEGGRPAIIQNGVDKARAIEGAPERGTEEMTHEQKPAFRQY